MYTTAMRTPLALPICHGTSDRNDEGVLGVKVPPQAFWEARRKAFDYRKIFVVDGVVTVVVGLLGVFAMIPFSFSFSMNS